MVLSDPYHPGVDYGNVPFARRERVLSTFLYELPFGKGRTYLNSNRALDLLVGGWELSGVALFQSGPFMSVAVTSDPSGAGYNLNGNFSGLGSRADTVAGVSPYAGQTVHNWSSSSYINAAAFVDPGSNIGRFGDESAGSIVGPGTQAVSLSLIKRFTIKERLRAEIGMQVANAFNHPDMLRHSDVGCGWFRSAHVDAERGRRGPRQIQLTGRITF